MVISPHPPLSEQTEQSMLDHMTAISMPSTQMVPANGDIEQVILSIYIIYYFILKKSFRKGGGIGSSPAIGADGTIYFGSGDTYFYAINLDGSLKWRFGPTGDIWQFIFSNYSLYHFIINRRCYHILPRYCSRWYYLLRCKGP